MFDKNKMPEGFERMHENDRHMYETLLSLTKFPMHSSLRSRFFEFLNDYVAFMVKIAPALSEDELKLLDSGKVNEAIKSYCDAVNYPFYIAKKVVEGLGQSL